uniref:SCP domain-containing protein n=1 Tax=Globodera pallida TaxID=36090 RepID=A0A183C5U8_GLOPA
MIWMPNRMIRYWYESNAKVGAFKPRKPLNSSKRMHRVDAKQMAKLGNVLVNVWAEIAIKNANVGSWDRLMEYVRYNSLPLDPRWTKRWDLCEGSN